MRGWWAAEPGRVSQGAKWVLFVESGGSWGERAQRQEGVQRVWGCGNCVLGLVDCSDE